MTRYEAYRLSSELWLSDIPEHWETRKIKYAFSERSEKGHPNEPLLVASQNKGVVPKNVYGLRTVEAMKDLHLLKFVQVGDFVISLRSFQGGIEYAYYQGIISPAYTVMTPKEMIAAGYFKYLAKSIPFIELLKFCVTGIREGQNIDYNKLKTHMIPIPPRSEQDQIVRYLDRQVSKINKLIAVKKKEIKLIKEHEKAITQHYIFHGTNDKTTEKQSGVDWIGNIPEGWNTTRIKFLFDMRDERNYKPLSEVNLISLYTNLGVVQNSDITYKSGNKARTADNYKIVHEDDIIVNIILCWMGAIGRSAYNGVTSPAYDIYVPKKNSCSRYYHYLFRLPVFAGECKKVGHGMMAMRWRTYSPEFRNIRVPEPPLDEQIKIANLLDEHSRQLEQKIKPLQEEISVLQELKNKLISDVVTGQIDVRDIKIPDFKYVDNEYLKEPSNDEEV